MVRSSRTLAALCFGLCATAVPLFSAHASTWANSTIAYISCISGVEYCSVTLASAAPTQPTCASHGPSMTLPLVNNANGHEMLKLIMAAKAANWTVSLTGTGACTTLGTQEDISMVQVH